MKQIPWIFFLIFSQTSWAADNVARAVNVSGRVLVRKGEDEKTSRILKQGDIVGPGDVINTSSNSTLKILLADQSIIDVGATSVFIFDTFELKSAEAVADRKVGVSMLYGKIRASVNKPLSNRGQFKVRTKSATMGVRGTEFIVSSQLEAPGAKTLPGGGVKGNTDIVVVKGKVAVDSPVANTARQAKSVEVNAGQKVTTVSQIGPKGNVVASEPPKVQSVSSQEMKSIQSEAKVQDNTFKQAVVVDPKAPVSESGGKETLAIIGKMIPLEARLDTRLFDFGLMGVFGPQLGFQSNYIPPGLTDENPQITISFSP